jgi:DNA-3-methyladenine glycosylase
MSRGRAQSEGMGRSERRGSLDALAVDPVTAARSLLGAELESRGVLATIVEVEAYGGPPGQPWPDAAAHSYGGPRPRNAVMFGPAGRMYTYRSYGIHVCANVVCGTEGFAAAVLLRSAVITEGVEVARSRRGLAVATAALARGPGNLCSALGILMTDNGIDLDDDAGEVRIRLKPPTGRLDGVAGPRVGVSTAADRPWRFWLPGHPEVSAYRRSPRAPAPGGSD